MSIRRLINRFKGMDDVYLAARRAGWGPMASFSRAMDPRWRSALRLFDGFPCQPGGVIVDVGANRGAILEAALLRFAPSKVVAIEPLPDAFGVLASKFASLPHIALYQCAVGNSEGSATLSVSRYEAASSLLPMTAEASWLFDRDLRPVNSIVVSVRTLDSITAEEQLESIDLLKLDVQGFELRVLQGAEKTLRKTKVVMIEVCFYPQYENGALFEDIHEFLCDRGFILRDLRGFQRGRDGILLQADALYTKAL